MSSHKFLVGVFDDDDVVMHAIPPIKSSGINIYEVYSPFAIHGIDDLMGHKRTKLSIAAFMFGFTGFCCAITMILFMMNIDWPMDVGGKSTLPAPSFVPVTFELTVLFTAFGMVGSFFVVSNLYPGATNVVFDPRCTDDKFIMAVELEKNSLSADQISSILKNNGATEVYEKEIIA